MKEFRISIQVSRAATNGRDDEVVTSRGFSRKSSLADEEDRTTTGGRLSLSRECDYESNKYRKMEENKKILETPDATR